jgi:hypothetical protein
MSTLQNRAQAAAADRADVGRAPDPGIGLPRHVWTAAAGGLVALAAVAWLVLGPRGLPWAAVLAGLVTAVLAFAAVSGTRDLRRLAGLVGAILLAILAFAQIQITPPFELTQFLLRTQDTPVLAAVGAVLLLLAAVPLPAVVGRTTEAIATWRWLPLALILLTGAIVVVGTRVVALDYPFSRDETMAVYDSIIVANGQIMAPVAPEWREYANALEPIFRLAVPGNVAIVSSYLPGNAAIRGALSLAFDRPMINAIVLVVGLVALYGVLRRLWPERRDVHAVGLILAVASSQVLFMAMTPYAMTAHFTLNMIWLWLFLRDTRWSHGLALAVGFVATGLHQLIFHPIFIAPFLLHLLLTRRLGLLAVYTVCYVAIGIFWIKYWALLLAWHGIAPEAAQTFGLAYLIDRIGWMLYYVSISSPETMLQNMLRFAAWQSPLLLVLLVPGIALAMRTGGVHRALVLGIVLTLLTMGILLPYQDIGWGYRYMHGLIGSAAILGALAWAQLTAGWMPAQRTAGWGVVCATSAAALLVMAPVHAAQMNAYITPHARAHAAIDKIPATFVVVETIGIYYGADLVRNDPYLRNRPIRLDLGSLDRRLIRELCQRGSIAVFDRWDAIRLGVKPVDPTDHAENPRFQALRAIIEDHDCRG